MFDPELVGEREFFTFSDSHVWGLCCLVLYYSLDSVTVKGEWLRQFCALAFCFLLDFQYVGVTGDAAHIWQLTTLVPVFCLHRVAGQGGGSSEGDNVPGYTCPDPQTRSCLVR